MTDDHESVGRQDQPELAWQPQPAVSVRIHKAYRNLLLAVVLESIRSYCACAKRGWIYYSNGRLKLNKKRLHAWIAEGHLGWHCIAPHHVELECMSLINFWNSHDAEVYLNILGVPHPDIHYILQHPDKVHQRLQDLPAMTNVMEEEELDVDEVGEFVP